MNRIHYTIWAEAPIAHGDLGFGDSGNITSFRRIDRIYQGRTVRVPALSAGAMRGVMRRAIWREVFGLCGLSRDTLAAPQWDRLYAALANGGHIEATEARVSPERLRARRVALPPLSAMGAALYSSHMAGRARVSNGWLACRELGDGFENERSFTDLLGEETRVRHVDREEQDPAVSGVSPMPTTTEVVITGARFVGHIAVDGAIEAAVMAHGLDQIDYVGGKLGQGFGQVRVEHDGDGTDWRIRLEHRAAELRDALLELAGQLGKSRKKASAGVS